MLRTNAITSPQIGNCLGERPDSTENGNSILLSQKGSLSLQSQKITYLDTGNDVIHNQVVIGAENQALQSIIPIEVVPSTSINGQLNNPLQNNTHVARVFEPIFHGAVERSFAQRHPTLTKLFAAFGVMLAYPVLFAVNVVVTPFLMGAAFFSESCGSGELANAIGASTIAKALWGEIADLVAQHQIQNWGMAVMAFVPLTGQQITTLSATTVIFDRLIKRAGSAGENAMIQKDIDDCSKLDQNVQRWVNELPEEERAEIKAQDWGKWTKDPTQNVWTGPLSALLQKLYEGAPKDGTPMKMAPGFASRMKNVLKVIQSDPGPFIPYVSTLGLSGLGTCVDRPVLTFLDLELRAQACQTLTDIKGGTETLQHMLNLAVRRLFFDETLHNLTVGMESIGRWDPIEAVLAAWEEIQQECKGDIPALPYRLFGTNVSKKEIANVVTAVVDLVTQRKTDTTLLYEFLAREDSPVLWKEAREACGSSLSNETQMKLAELETRANDLKTPNQPLEQSDKEYYASPPYKEYLLARKLIIEERNQLESGVYLDKGQWRVA